MCIRDRSHIVRPLGKPFPSSAAVSPFLRNFAGASSHFPLRNGFIPFLDSHSCKRRVSPKFPEVQRAVPRSALESAPGMRASPLSSFPGCALAARTTFCTAPAVHRASTGKALPQLCGRFAFSPEFRGCFFTLSVQHIKTPLEQASSARPKGVFARVLLSHNFLLKLFDPEFRKGRVPVSYTHLFDHFNGE